MMTITKEFTEHLLTSKLISHTFYLFFLLFYVIVVVVMSSLLYQKTQLFRHIWQWKKVLLFCAEEVVSLQLEKINVCFFHTVL